MVTRAGPFPAPPQAPQQLSNEGQSFSGDPLLPSKHVYRVARTGGIKSSALGTAFARKRGTAAGERRALQHGNDAFVRRL